MTASKTETLQDRIRAGNPRPGDDQRLVQALGIADDGPEGLALCSRALGGSVDAALDLWRRCMPGQAMRIQVSHTPSALKMCAHLLKQVEER